LSFTKHIIDEFSHGLGATVLSAASAVLKVIHHMTNELREGVGYLQTVLCNGHPQEVAVLSQRHILLCSHSKERTSTSMLQKNEAGQYRKQ